MDSQNIKVYLAVSGALIILLILIIVIPFSKKSSSPLIPNSLTPNPSSLLPTSVETNSSPNNQVTNNPLPITINASFTGAIDEPVPQQIIDLAAQKKDLQQKTPIDLSAFSIDFDYNQDKFIVILKDPKDQARTEFESWKNSNYSKLGADQFLIK